LTVSRGFLQISLAKERKDLDPESIVRSTHLASDLVPAVNRVKTRFPAKQITVYVPSRNPVRGAAVELRATADKNRDLPLNLLKISASRVHSHASGRIHC
jgi:hypothetical protein